MADFNLNISSGLGYTDRGDVSSYDFSKGGLIIDSGWHELDLSEIIPEGTKVVKLRIDAATVSSANSFVDMMVDGHTNTYNLYALSIFAPGYHHPKIWEIPVGANRKVSYRIHNVEWSFLDIIVMGWFV